MMDSFFKNEESLGEIFEEEMDFCLGCLACETACPAGVKYGKLHQLSKDIIIKNHPFRFRNIFIKLFLNQIIANPKVLNFFSTILRNYQKSFIKKIISKLWISQLLPENIKLRLGLLPIISSKFSNKLIPENIYSENRTNKNVAFHFGCIMNVAFAKENLDTINVLKKSDCNIFTPKDQVCCGALHSHNGEIDKAKKLAKKNIDIFSKGNYEYLISNSAGCGAFMKEYKDLLKDDVTYKDKAKVFSNKVIDISEYISKNLSKLNFHKSDELITYHDACHLVHGQKIFNQPREILNNICESRFKELKDSTKCCGSAGIYNILRTEESMILLEDKMKNVSETKANIVITSNPGCLLQLRYYVKKHKSKIRIEHISSFINSNIKENIV